MFVRVTEVPSQGVWKVDAEVTTSFPDRAAALAFAHSLAPEWLEIGEVREGRHVWRTLRRMPDGGYAESRLRWGGR